MFSSTRHRLRYKHGTHQNRDESAGECSSVSQEEGTFILCDRASHWEEEECTGSCLDSRGKTGNLI